MKLEIIFFTVLLVGTFAYPQSSAGSFHSGRLVGGTNATEREFPFHVHLEIFASNNWWHFVGGVIYDDRRIVTTAQALYGPIGSDYVIRAVAGDVNLDAVSKNEQTRYLVDAVLHPDFDVVTLNNDMAIITVDPPFDFNEYVQPLRLAETTLGDPQGEVVSIGFGTHDFSKPMPVLQKATMNVIDLATCDAMYKSYPASTSITETMVCASAPGKEICTNDMGGALIGKDVAGREYLAGIAIWGASECEGYPSVFTNVAALRGWLDSTLDA